MIFSRIPADVVRVLNVAFLIATTAILALAGV